ncbi:tRNA pseudouridine synthase A [Shouchella clausii]|uniref:tRNA pseudouridine(38-40) synthase TruA n=1 Tax=Shouchella tritolerans TaxID=2979466 RepID=UPI001B11EBBC|nr:tRNA pseudouridine(38-40) synthase TruA [Shouchella tritolerans]GIN14511.1 tRNA pseudouridine synthase A [Shouchella clausii]
MSRMACKLSYDGTAFAGYQVQPGKRTVQSEVERALQEIHKGARVPVVASGRTDAGVHACGQVLHFDTELAIAPERWVSALNTHLPDDIVVTNAAMVEPDFHARYGAQAKEYRYYIQCGPFENVFRRHFAVHIKQALDVPAMQTAAKHLLGTHDFSAFCAANTTVVDKVRTITHVAVQPSEEGLLISIRGTGFLYNMVRIIVGTLLEIGTGKRVASEMKVILAGKSRNLAGKTAPAHGLCLYEVDYGQPLFVNETPGQVSMK